MAKNFTAVPPGSSTGNWFVSIADDVWDIERSGPTSAFTDKWDTAANIITAVNNGSASSYVSVGQRYNVVICNSSSAVETLQAPSSGGRLTLVPASGTAMTVTPGTCSHFGLLITAVGTSPTITIVQEPS